MTMQKSEAIVSVADAPAQLEGLLELMRRHDVVVTQEDGVHVGHFPSGQAHLSASAERVEMRIEAPDMTALNAIKLELTGSLTYVYGQELNIDWSGGTDVRTPLPKLCVLTVQSVEQLTPHMRRITFSGDNLIRFAENSNLHMRLAFPDGAVDLPLPMVNGRGRVVWPEGAKMPVLRKYTVRKVDLESGTVAVDFVLHDDAGPGSRFAAAARPGDVIAMIGPGGLTAAAADWLLLAGDETALPAIGRILEGLPPTARGVAFIEVAGPSEEQPLVRPDGFDVKWLHRNGAASGTTALLIEAIRAADFPAEGSVFVWAAAEFEAFRSIRTHLRKERGLSADRQLVVAYWRKGSTEDEMGKAH